MDDATQRFIGIFTRLTLDWSRITTFREMGTYGQGLAREVMLKSNVDYIQNTLLRGNHKHFLKDPESFERDGFAELAILSMTESAVKTFRQTLDAASLVFAHSMLDGAMFDCLHVCALLAPEEWLRALEDKKVGLREVEARSFNQLLRDAIEGELGRLERQSLVAKIDRLFSLCKPKKQIFLTDGFVFNRDRLLALDTLRHVVVHSPGKPQTFEDLHNDLEFMKKCGLHVFSMIQDRFGLQFSGSQLFESFRARSQSNE
jgi:hypothetical protein